MPLKYITSRSWDVVPFDPQRIHKAIYKAYLSTQNDSTSDIDTIVEKICDALEEQQTALQDNDFLHVEMIQNTVEKELMKAEKFDEAKEYIIYRSKHNKFREEKHQQELAKLQDHSLMVVKTDGNRESFDLEKIRVSYNRIAGNLTEKCPFDELAESLKKYLVDNIKTTDINLLLVKTAVNLISIENISRQDIAGRFATIDLYKKASRQRNLAVPDLYLPQSFLSLVKEYVADDLYYQHFFDKYSDDDFLQAGAYIKPERDMIYNYTTLLMLKKRYLLNPNKIIKELPQHMYMAVALFLAIPESRENRLAMALQIYDAISLQKLSLATPTLMNARRKFHQLSSCFVLSIDDDLRSIYHNIENIAQISKYGGGVGTYLWHVRSKWWSIRWVKGVSWWVIPWVKVINDTAIAVNQQWVRAGAISVTNDIRHRDIMDFLSMQTETWDIRRKAFDIFPAISVPDLFMERVRQNKDRTLFDPKEIYDLTWKRLEDSFGQTFNDFYHQCEKDPRIELK